MKMKRLIALFLAVALTGALALPATAGSGSVATSFADVTDPVTAVDADVLRLMGVVSGMGNNCFNPNFKLTRAAFATMAVQFMGHGDQVALHTTRTVFSDVGSSHWAMAYVNLASSLKVKDGDTEIPLIAGTGGAGGTFEPDRSITFAEAATILLRVLSYGSAQTGASWPEGYLNLAKSIGLTDGISAASASPISRAQAARLFVNALRCKTSAGTAYYSSLGTVQENTVLLATNVLTDDGTRDGAISTSGGVYLPKAENVKPVALQGKRGALVLNSKQEIVTFVPDDSSAVTVTLAGDAQPSYLKASNGTQYTVSGSATLYTSDKTEGVAYVSGYSALKSGSQITLFSERGKIVAIYAEGSSSSVTDAVVVRGTPGTAMFHRLTDGAEGYTILKNRQAISMSAIREYDVVTYDAMTNTLIVSDLRLTCVYEDASPNAKAPETIKVLGHSFDVLDCAWDTTASFSLNSIVSLLLTADGKVAGMAQSSSKTRSTAMGMLSTGGAVLFLPGGGEIALTGSVSGGSTLSDRLVALSSSAKGKISASTPSVSSVPGAFDIAAMKLGSYTVAAGVRLYEQVGDGAMAAIDLSGLDMTSVPAADVAYYRLNSSDMVDYLVLKAVTGDAYTYGKLTVGEQTGGSGEMSFTNRTVTVENGSKTLGPLVTGHSFKNGGFGGVVEGSDGKAVSVVELTELKTVSPSDFFVSQGVSYVTLSGKTYRVANDVLCFKTDAKTWFAETSGADRLAACKAFSDNLTVYLDPIGEKVRIVAAS